MMSSRFLERRGNNNEKTRTNHTKLPVYLYAKLRGKDCFQDKLEKLARVKDYDSSEYIGCVIWLSWGEKDIFPRKWFDETIMMPFGKYEFRVPKEYDKVLRHEYGDYMQLGARI